MRSTDATPFVENPRLRGDRTGCGHISCRASDEPAANGVQTGACIVRQTHLQNWTGIRPPVMSLVVQDLL